MMNQYQSLLDPLMGCSSAFCWCSPPPPPPPPPLGLLGSRWCPHLTGALSLLYLSLCNLGKHWRKCSPKLMDFSKQESNQAQFHPISHLQVWNMHDSTRFNWRFHTRNLILASFLLNHISNVLHSCLVAWSNQEKEEEEEEEGNHWICCYFGC